MTASRRKYLLHLLGAGLLAALGWLLAGWAWGSAGPGHPYTTVGYVGGLALFFAGVIRFFRVASR